jgi:hypothetical protein
MKKLTRFVNVVTELCYCHFAQQSESVEMADALRSSGKIYVVMAYCDYFFRPGYLSVFYRPQAEKNRKKSIIEKIVLYCLNTDFAMHA